MCGCVSIAFFLYGENGNYFDSEHWFNNLKKKTETIGALSEEKKNQKYTKIEIRYSTRLILKMWDYDSPVLTHLIRSGRMLMLINNNKQFKCNIVACIWWRHWIIRMVSFLIAGTEIHISNHLFFMCELWVIKSERNSKNIQKITPVIIGSYCTMNSIRWPRHMTVAFADYSLLFRRFITRVHSSDSYVKLNLLYRKTIFFFYSFYTNQHKKNICRNWSILCFVWI